MNYRGTVQCHLGAFFEVESEKCVFNLRVRSGQNAGPRAPFVRGGRADTTVPALDPVPESKCTARQRLASSVLAQA